ncbi:MAG TPA: hypothetical protein VIY48_18230 [Candidatus Paceibacterota bacterium]
MPRGFDKQYRPGSRKALYRPGRFTPGRIAWTTTYAGQYAITHHPEVKENEPGPSIKMNISRGSGRPIVIDATSLTMEELLQLRKAFNLLFDLAEPIVRERDRVAQDAYDKGDDSYTRSYRSVPRFVIREGEIGPDGQSVYDGPESIPLRYRWPGGAGYSEHPEEELRDAGSEVAELQPEENSNQDNASEDDES